jgi:histidyl-tRNA synthetase
MASKYQAPRGTFDILPAQGRARARLERAAAEIFARAGYEPIATPAFEDTALFERGVGRSTDIVRKEMFTFEDKGERSLTLRPEGTASICRAYLEHGMHKLAQPVKLSYLGPFFRHERPQAGRYRQFHQLGIECIGSDSPLADAEVIMLLSDLLAELGVPGVELRLGSLGSFETRRAYLEDLKAHLHANEGELS